MSRVTGSDPFIGREREMAELTAALDAALEDRGGLVMLVGDPGIGKTRLTEELDSVARDRGMLLARGVCYEGGSTPPYWPWTQVIRSLLTQPSERTLTALDATAGVIAEIVPEVGNMLPDLEPALEVEPEQARFRLFNSVTSFLNDVAASQPLVVVLDDLHWADGATLDLLEFVERDISSSPVLLVGCYRGVELSRRHPLTQTLASLARVRGFQRIPVRGLAGDEVGRLVEAVGGIAPLSALVEEIHDRTEGNPFFIAEVTRDLVRENANSGDDLGPTRGFRIPEGVREAIGTRLNHLSEESNRVLRIAAVIGREFEFALLERLIPRLPSGRLLGVLEEALSAGIVEEVPHVPGRSRFTHALIQETVAQEFSAARRARLHGEIGEALEELYAENTEAHADELAYHFSLAERVPGEQKLVRYSLLAGERALATYAWQEALGHFQRGLAAKEGQAIDADRAALLFGLGRAQAATLERYLIHEAVNTVKPAFDYFVAAGDVPAALAIAEYPFMSLRREGGLVELLAAALNLAPSGSHQAGRLLERYGFALNLELGEFETAIKALDQALSIAQRENDTALELIVLNRVASVHMMNLNPEKSLENSLRAITLARDDGRTPLDHGVHWWASAALTALGDLQQARPHAAESLSLAEKRGNRFNIGQAFCANEAVAHLQGDWETARDFSDRGLAVDHRNAILVPNRAVLEYELGEFAQGDVYLERLVETMKLSLPAPAVEHSITSAAIGVAARITGATRHFDIAEAAARTVLSSPSPVSFMAQLARTGLALIAVERGDAALASEQYDALKSWQITLTVLNMVNGHRVLGLLAQTMGRTDDAIAHFKDSLAFCRKAGARPELAWTSYDYAGTLLQRGGPGDQPRAASLVDQALAISNELGMRPLAKRAVALQGEVRLVPEGTPANPAGLTGREIEVLLLMAKGRTTREIAGELVISPRTVQRHTTNLYAKINARNRAEATAFALSELITSTEPPPGA